jgi:hypothetical protein
MAPTALPDLVTSTPAILIKLADWQPDDDRELPRRGYGFRYGMTDAELLDSTRAWWVLSLPRAERYRYAVAVHGGITRGVWEIEPGSWRQASPATARRLGRSARRFAFAGLQAPADVRAAFVGPEGRLVPAPGPFGSGSVIAYWG